MQGASRSVHLEGIESLYNYFFDLYISVYALHADICWQFFETENAAQKKTQHGNKKKREQMKIVKCEKDDQMLAMSWIIRKERPWDVDVGGFA